MVDPRQFVLAGILWFDNFPKKYRTPFHLVYLIRWPADELKNFPSVTNHSSSSELNKNQAR